MSNSVASAFLLAGAVFLAFGSVSAVALLDETSDQAIHDTYYLVAHAWYVGSFTLLFGIFALVYLGFRRLIGVNYNRWLGAGHFLLWTCGVALIAIPQHLLSMRSIPRRYTEYPPSLSTWDAVVTTGVYLTLASCVLLVLVIVEAIVRRWRAPKAV